MQDISQKKLYYYFDESGSPEIMARKGVNLVNENKTSKVFIVGFIHTEHPREIFESLKKVHEEIMTDDYLASIPSIVSSKKMFHANKDCAEVREKVYKALKDLDFGFQCIVARKKLSIFKKKYELKSSLLYKDLVVKLMRDRLHLNTEIDCYFSAMKNVVKQGIMEDSINEAIQIFSKKWKIKPRENRIRVIIQSSTESYQLQAVDYILWAIYQVYEHNDFRYYNFIKDKVDLILDVFDYSKNPYGTYYTKKNPITIEKLSPL